MTPTTPAAARPTRLHGSAGRFVTFEGGEGSGKTTQLQYLAGSLRERGIGVTTTREPGGTPIAEAVRRFLLSGAAKPLGPDTEAVLFAAARGDHIEKLIRPALASGQWVLCDRFMDSTRAYQGTAGVDSALIRALERVTVWPFRPDLTIILDVPAELGLRRAAARSDDAPDRFEGDDLQEHERRRQAFLEIAAAEPERCLVVDGARPEAEVAEVIWQAVVDRLLVEEADNG